MPIYKASPVWGGTQSATTNTSLAMAAQGVNLGDFLVLGVAVRASTLATGLSPTSSLGNTYSQLGQISEAAAIPSLFTLYGGFITVAGSETITWNWTNTGAASAIGSRWRGVAGTTAATALDVAVTTHGATGSSTWSSTPTAATVTDSDLVIAYSAQGSPTVTISNQAFSPVGNVVSVPDTAFQTTGSDATISQFSETMSGVAGATQSFSANSSASGAYAIILAVFAPSVATDSFVGAQGQGGGNAG